MPGPFAPTLMGWVDVFGFGLPPGAPSLGDMALQARNNLDAPWIAFSVFTALGGLLMLLIFVGEAIRDAFDPRKTLGEF